MHSQFEMVKLFKEALELCAVKPSETLIVLSEGSIRADYADATPLAGRDLGVHAFGINVPLRQVRETKTLVGRTAIAGNRPVIEALKQVDKVIDLMGMLFSHEQNEITATGTRMLMVREPIDILRKMFPDKNLRRRVEYGEMTARQSQA